MAQPVAPRTVVVLFRQARLRVGAPRRVAPQMALLLLLLLVPRQVEPLEEEPQAVRQLSPLEELVQS
jgi:hypothetical protein